jgi:hypothetical protein
MPIPRSYKTDESFLEKIAIGAIGTRRIFDHLVTAGHRPIELERGSMNYKIWKKIKIKRVRVPDLLCTACGIRVESRAKTNLLITMSHSESSPERGWDYGLADEDNVGLVLCQRTGDRPVDWAASDLVQYIQVKHLRDAFRSKKVATEKPKGAGEGFEIRVTWPAVVASYGGRVVEIKKDTLKYKRAEDDRDIRVQLQRKNLRLTPQVKVGNEVAECRILASVVPVATQIECRGGVTDRKYITDLKSASLSDRYAAAKALGAMGARSAVSALRERLNDENEHLYVRLEAAASLVRLDEGNAFKALESFLGNEYLETQLETVIILGEIPHTDSTRLLINTLKDPERHSEIRAGAAWAIGELKSQQGRTALIECFRTVETEVRIEAARALVKLARDSKMPVLEGFSDCKPEERAGIAWALGKSGNVSVTDLIGRLADEDTRQWCAWVLGSQDSAKLTDGIEQLRSKDPEVYFAITVLWKIMSSWVYGLDEY